MPLWILCIWASLVWRDAGSGLIIGWFIRVGLVGLNCNQLVMDNANEVSSSLSFASYYLSNGSSNPNISACTSHELVANLENLSMTKLSGSLEKLLIWLECSYSDVDIVVEDKPLGIHSCILASRSQFVIYCWFFFSACR